MRPFSWVDLLVGFLFGFVVGMHSTSDANEAADREDYIGFNIQALSYEERIALDPRIPFCQVIRQDEHFVVLDCSGVEVAAADD